MRSQPVANKQIPVAQSIQTLLTLSDHGTTGAVTDQGAAVFDLRTSEDIDYHEGLFRIEILTTGGQGVTPTAVGASKTFTFSYAFSNVEFDVSEIPVVLDTAKDTIVCALPNDISVQAVGTFTFTGLPTAGQTVTIGSRVYTFRAVAAYPGEVTIGANGDATATNLIDAINGDDDAETPAHADVTAATGGASIVDVTAIEYGAAGNSVATTDTASNASWGDVTLTSGSSDGTALHVSDPFIHEGQFLSIWYDRDAFTADALIDVSAKLIRL